MAKPGRDEAGRFLPGFTTCPGGNPASLPPPGDAHLTHGFARRWAVMSCNACCLRNECASFVAGGRCAEEETYMEQRRSDLLASGRLDPVLDGPALALLLWSEVRLHRAARYLAKAGELLPGAEAGYLEIQPLSKSLLSLLNAWRLLAAELGLTPMQRAKLMATERVTHPLAAAILGLGSGGGENGNE